MGTQARKLCFVQERIRVPALIGGSSSITRIAAIAVFANPFAGQSVTDLSALFETGHALGAQLADELLTMFTQPVVSYGKAAIVGVNGEPEHGHALIHPRLGQAMRAPIGGGEALIPSNVKTGSAGVAMDVPLGHKDDAWRFTHFDTMTVSVADAPRPDELALIVAFADGGRPHPRIGTARAS